MQESFAEMRSHEASYINQKPYLSGNECKAALEDPEGLKDL